MSYPFPSLETPAESQTKSFIPQGHEEPQHPSTSSFRSRASSPFNPAETQVLSDSSDEEGKPQSLSVPSKRKTVPVISKYKTQSSSNLQVSSDLASRNVTKSISNPSLSAASVASNKNLKSSPKQIKPSLNKSPKGGSRKVLPRVAMACEPCRLRKHKCDGKDLCERCEKKGIECVYDEISPNERRKAAREFKKKALMMEEEKRKLESNSSRSSGGEGVGSKRFTSDPAHSKGLGSEKVVRRRRITLSTSTLCSRNTSPPSPSKRARFTTLELDAEPIPWSSPHFNSKETDAQQSEKTRPSLSTSFSWDETWDSNRISRDSKAYSTSSGSSISLLESSFDREPTEEGSLLFSPLRPNQPSNISSTDGATNPSPRPFYYGNSFTSPSSSQEDQDISFTDSHKSPYLTSTTQSHFVSNYPTPTQFNNLSLHSPLSSDLTLPPLLHRRTFDSLSSMQNSSNISPRFNTSTSLPNSPSQNQLDLTMYSDFEEMVDFNP